MNVHELKSNLYKEYNKTYTTSDLCEIMAIPLVWIGDNCSYYTQ